jgi:hypothetical protein
MKGVSAFDAAPAGSADPVLRPIMRNTLFQMICIDGLSYISQTRYSGLRVYDARSRIRLLVLRV